MRQRHKSEFELINNSLWLLLKPYVQDEAIYKKIMSEIFNVYMIKDTDKDKFSDAWFESLRDLYDVPEKYKKYQEVCGFGADLADGFYEWLEWQYKSNDSIKEFYRIISDSFLSEWERLKDGCKSADNSTEKGSKKSV